MEGKEACCEATRNERAPIERWTLNSTNMGPYLYDIQTERGVRELLGFADNRSDRLSEMLEGGSKISKI